VFKSHGFNALRFNEYPRGYEIVVGYSKVTASRWEVEAEQAFCGGCDYFNEESYNGGENYFFTDDISSSYVQQALLNPIAQVADCDANSGNTEKRYYLEYINTSSQNCYGIQVLHFEIL